MYAIRSYYEMLEKRNIFLPKNELAILVTKIKKLSGELKRDLHFNEVKNLISSNI